MTEQPQPTTTEPQTMTQLGDAATRIGEVVGLIGENPRAVERIMSMQYAITRQAPGGINQQAMAAVEKSKLGWLSTAMGGS